MFFLKILGLSLYVCNYIYIYYVTEKLHFTKILNI